MARHYTGRDGALYLSGNKVGKVRNWAITGNAAALETTTLEDTTATYISGNLSYSGSATVLMYENDANLLEGKGLLDPIFRTSANNPEAKLSFELRMSNGSKTRRLSFQAIMTSAALSFQQAGLVEYSVDFNVTGPLTTVEL